MMLEQKCLVQEESFSVLGRGKPMNPVVFLGHGIPQSFIATEEDLRVNDNLDSLESREGRRDQ